MERRIGVGLNFYNVAKELPRMLDSCQSKHLDITIYAIDGKHYGYQDKNKSGLSDDGSREIVKSYDNVKLFDMPNVTQVQKRNKYLIEAGKDFCEFLVICDSDVWLTGSWRKVQEHAREMFRQFPEQYVFTMPNYREIEDYPYQITFIPRLVREPREVRYAYKHNWFYRYGVRQVADRKQGHIVWGMVSRMNKDFRTEKRIEAGHNYKVRNNGYESMLRKKVDNLLNE